MRRVHGGRPRIVRQGLQQTIRPFGGQFFDGVVDSGLPPGGDVGEVFLFEPVLDNVESIMPIEHDIDGIFDAGRAGPRGVKGEEANLHGEIHAGVIAQDTVEERLAIAGFADDAIRRPLAHLDPIALRINEI